MVKKIGLIVLLFSGILIMVLVTLRCTSIPKVCISLYSLLSAACWDVINKCALLKERGHGSQRRGRMGNARVIRRHHHHQLTDDLGLDLTDAVLVQQGRHHHDGPEVYKGPRRRGTTYSCTRGAAPSRKRTSCRSGKRGGITKQVELTVSTDVSRRFHVDGLCGL